MHLYRPGMFFYYLHFSLSAALLRPCCNRFGAGGAEGVEGVTNHKKTTCFARPITKKGGYALANHKKDYSRPTELRRRKKLRIAPPVLIKPPQGALFLQ